ncbi:hypothetical protein GpartN1_g3288.t1 [Galdieria partita]|uniref:DUF1995 domain-containing protein n=1 Tax=Galdieria partita TaxID=83374 RepID=A0A9C7UQG8_9RHOD|nr:hypothetical protein GpartN1_g142.t1 [Galdieria partita]GJQ11497.1 hypothetical protein GpartN1_g3288.t1 [Galdieria partita]
MSFSFQSLISYNSAILCCFIDKKRLDSLKSSKICRSKLFESFPQCSSLKHGIYCQHPEFPMYIREAALESSGSVMSAILSNWRRVRVDILKREFVEYSPHFSRDNLFILVRFITDAIKKVQKKPLQIIFPNIALAARARNYFGAETIADISINSLENIEWKHNTRCIILVMPFLSDENDQWNNISSMILQKSLFCVLLNPQSRDNTEIERFPNFSFQHYNGWKDYESVYFLHSFVLVDTCGSPIEVVVYKKHPFGCKVYFRPQMTLKSSSCEWNIVEWNQSFASLPKIEEIVQLIYDKYTHQQ